MLSGHGSPELASAIVLTWRSSCCEECFRFGGVFGAGNTRPSTSGKGSPRQKKSRIPDRDTAEAPGGEESGIQSVNQKRQQFRFRRDPFRFDSCQISVVAALDDCRDGRAEPVHVAGGHAGDVDASTADDVDRVFLLEPVDLILWASVVAIQATSASVDHASHGLSKRSRNPI